MLLTVVYHVKRVSEEAQGSKGRSSQPCVVAVGALFYKTELQFMTATVKSLAETVVLLPPKARAYLAERLLESLDEAGAEQAWIDEAKRRRDEVRSGKVKPVPAEEVYRRIERLIGQGLRHNSCRSI